MGSGFQGSASFLHGGETYDLTLNNKVLLKAEDVLGYSALDAAEEAKNALAQGRNPMLRTVIAIFYGALVQQHPGISEDEAVDIFMDDDKAAQTAFAKALKATDIPKSGNRTAAAKTAQKAKKSPGRGKKSSKAGAKTSSPRKNSG